MKERYEALLAALSASLGAGAAAEAKDDEEEEVPVLAPADQLRDAVDALQKQRGYGWGPGTVANAGACPTHRTPVRLTWHQCSRCHP